MSSVADLDLPLKSDTLLFDIDILVGKGKTLSKHNKTTFSGIDVCSLHARLQK